MQTFIDLLSYQFFQNALAAAFVASILSGFIGTYIVSRRMVFVTDGITHSSFGGLGIAYFFGLNPFLGAVLFGVGTALGIEWMSRKGNIREDSAIAILWAVGMATGIVFVFLTPGYTPNLMSFLFGNILNVTKLDIVILSSLAIAVASFFMLFYRVVLLTAHDPEFASASGVPVNAFRYVLMILIALTVVFSIKIAGIILVMSIFTIPQIIASVFTRNFGTIIPLSMLFAFLGLTGGLISSYFADFPSGASIILALVVLWGLLKGFTWMIRWRKQPAKT